MATITITITDRPNGEVTSVCESKPPMPMTDGNPDVDLLTPAQATAIFVLMEAVKASAPDSEWRTLIT